MEVQNVTLPNGRKVRDVPPNATRQQVFDAAIKLNLATPDEVNGWLKNPPAPSRPGAPGRTAEEIYKEKRKTLPQGSWYDEIWEPAQSLGANMAGTVAGGLGWIGDMVTGEGPAKSLENMQETQRSFAEWGAPETQRGQEATRKVGERVQALTEMVRSPAAAATLPAQDPALTQRVLKEGPVKTIGDEILMATDNPYLAALFEAGTIGAGMLVGAKAAPGRQALGVKQTPLRNTGRAIMAPLEARRRRLAKAQNDEMARRQAFRQGIPDERAAGYYELPDGTIMRDARLSAMVREGERQGFTRPGLANAHMANDADKQAMLQMMAIKRTAQHTGDMRHRPSDIPGQIISDQYEAVKQVRNAAGAQLDDVARGLKGQTVDFTGPLNEFRQDLFRTFDVLLDSNNNPVFRGSILQDIPEAQNILSRLIARMKEGARWGPKGYTPDAYDVHRLKRWIDVNVDYGKQLGGVSGQMETILKKFRRALDTELDNRFPDYDRANTMYSDSVGAINELRSISRTMDFDGIYAGSNMGQLLRRILSNQVSRNRVAGAVDDIARVYSRWGGQDVVHNPHSLMMFANELDQAFGSSSPMSFMGQVQQGTRLGLEQAAGGRGAASAFGRVVEPVAQGVRGVNEQNAFNILEQILHYNPRRP